MMKVILTGSTSQLGHAIISNKPKNIDLLAFSRKELDLTSKKECTDVINKNNPDWIINAAAYTKVDLAEDYGELAMTINSKAPEIFSKVLKDKGGKLIQISTDYVFNGSVNTPYNTNNKRNPLGQYGLSKASGEQAIERIFSKSGQYIILRTSWLMGPIGENFIKTMLKLHSSRNKIEVVYDQIGSPTSTFSLARICWEIIRQYSDLSNKDKVLPDASYKFDSLSDSISRIPVATGSNDEYVMNIPRIISSSGNDDDQLSMFLTSSNKFDGTQYCYDELIRSGSSWKQVTSSYWKCEGVLPTITSSVKSEIYQNYCS